jgi:TP901 family phage tail tape measure protein
MALGNAAQLAIILKLVDKATPGLKKATKQTETMSQKMNKLGSSLTRNVSLPLLAVVGAGVKVYADFDKTMTNLEARTGATAAEMEAFREAAIKMGRDSAFSATQAADAILELTSSGSSATEALEQLTPVLNLAAAGQLELGESADIVTDTLAQFQLGAEDSTFVANQLAKAAQSSSADVRMMADAMSKVGPIANVMGLSLDQTAAAIAQLHEAGIKGVNAGTSLKSMLAKMASPVKSTQNAWAALGTTLFDSAGNMRDLDTVLKDINKGMENMTQEERIRTIEALAGGYGKTGLAALLAADGIDDMQTAMEGSQTAQQVAAKQMESFVGQLNQLKGSLETFMITVVGPFVDKYLKPMVEWLVNAVNVVTDLATRVPAFGEAIMGVVVALIALGPALKVMSMLSGLGKLFSGLTTITRVLTVANMQLAASWLLAAAPLLAVVAAGVALGVVLYEIGRALKIGDRVKEWVADFRRGIGMISNKLSQWWGDIKRFVGRLPGELLRFFENLIDSLFEKGIVGAIEKGGNLVADAVLFLPTQIGKLLLMGSPSRVMTDLGHNAGTSFVNGIARGIQSGVGPIGKSMSGLAQAMMLGMRGTGGMGQAGGVNYAALQGRQIRRGSISGGISAMPQRAGIAAMGSWSQRLGNRQQLMTDFMAELQRGNYSGELGRRLGIHEDDPFVAKNIRPRGGDTNIYIQNALGTPDDLANTLQRRMGRNLSGRGVS